MKRIDELKPEVEELGLSMDKIRGLHRLEYKISGIQQLSDINIGFANFVRYGIFANSIKFLNL